MFTSGLTEPNVEDSAWVRRLHPSSARRRLICLPHAGGAATYFAPLAAALSDSFDVVAIQYPGRQERLSEPCLDSIQVLAEAIVPELDPWLDRPFALFGHSMGAVVAFEVARVLEHDHGRVPAGLFVSGRRGPTTRRNEQFHKGGDRSLLNQVARLQGTPSWLIDDHDVRQMMLPALRGDYKAIETYVWQPGPPLSCPIWAIFGADDPLTTEHEAAAWAAHTTGGFEVCAFPAGHFYLATHLSELAALLSDRLVSA
jgi:pyochelin biosynthetic protein PchC